MTLVIREGNRILAMKRPRQIARWDEPDKLPLAFCPNNELYISMKACKWPSNDIKPSSSFIRGSTDNSLCSEDWVHSYAYGIGLFHISSSFYLQPLRIRLDDDQEGLSLIDNGFYLHLTKDTIFGAN